MKALILIDIQIGLTQKKGLYNKSIFIETVNDAIRKFRESGDCIVFLQHNNKQLIQGTSDWEIDPGIEKHDKDIIIQKHHANAFEKTELKSMLDKDQVKVIVVGGLVSHGCVKMTCIGGLNEGYTTHLLANGHTNWNKDAIKKIASTESELIQLGVKLIDKEAL